MHTVIETPLFSRLWPRYWLEEERGKFAACHPTVGDVIQGTGGLRKVRWSRAGSGKSGGVRIIYFSHLDDELVLLTMYAKSERGSLTIKQLVEIKHALDL